MHSLEVQLWDTNHDLESWALQAVNDQIVALGDSADDETKRIQLLKEKESLQYSLERRAERMGVGTTGVRL